MGHALSYPSPYAEERKTAYLGMVIMIASWAMMFVTLFLVYGAMRFNAKEWPPIGLPLPSLTLPTLNTFIMLASSFTLEYGLRDMRRGKARTLAPMLLLTTVLGAAFVYIQYLLGLDLHSQGLGLERGAYAAVLYGLSGIHAAHVALGILALAILTILAFRGAYTPARHLRVRLWSVYWHFVGVVWIAMYLLIFVV